MKTAPACTIAVFGAVGDLTKTLLMPAIYNLTVAGLLDPAMRFLGLDHNDRDAGSWRAEIDQALAEFTSKQGGDSRAGTAAEKARSFVLERLDYTRFDFTADTDYDALAQRLAQTANVLFYLAVAPRFFEPIVTGLGRAGMLAENTGRFRRVIVEKPLGRDLDSARRLNTSLTALAADTQLYRIDHFLGKEAVQGISALRFANRLFEPLFHRESVAGVQITAAETGGIEERGSFYESTGALRDMIPNHLFSLLTLVAMDEPATFETDVVRDAKATLLGSLRPIAPSDVVRGQYAAGIIDGRSVRGYREEENVAPDSRTETYAALCVHIENDRWRGVPFYLRTGKRMRSHVTTIALTLRPSTGPITSHSMAPSVLVLGIDPQRGLIARFAAKRPGVDFRLGPAAAGFRYETTFDEPPNVGYETLLFHAMIGESLLFQRADMIELEWTAVEPAIAAWERTDEKPQSYVAGSDGPDAADDLLARNGDRWFGVEPLERLGLVTTDPRSDRGAKEPDSVA